jgi:heme A synthase
MSTFTMILNTFLVVSACLMHSFLSKKRKRKTYPKNVRYLMITIEYVLLFVALGIFIFFLAIPAYNYYS